VKFSNPWWLAAGFLACVVLAWMWRRYDVRQHAALERFVAARLRVQLTQSISTGRRRLHRGLFLAALALLFIALAGPLVGYRWEKINRRGNEIVFAIDASRSMSTPDIKPNRLTRAKLAIDDFTHQLDGDAVGIVAFAGRAFLVCPITLDYGAFHESLNAIDMNTIPRGGTNISSAIHEAQAALRRRPGTDKILILVTDGEDLEGDALAAAQTAARQDGLKIYTVGVGTAGGDLIPLPRDQGGGFVKDESGGFVKSRLDESALKAIAAATGGFYVPLGTEGEGLETIFKTVLGPMAKHDLASRQQKIYIERYQWPLAASLGALLVSLLIGTRKRERARRSLAPGIAASWGLMLLAVLTCRPTLAVPANQPAPTPQQPVGEYNAGTAAYRAGQFPQAVQAFQQSIIHYPSSDPRRLADQEDAYYNLGNALYRAGQKTEQSDPQETIRQWTEAVKVYETALQLRADDADSKYNRDLVKRKIDALKQNQNQNKNKNQGKGQGEGQGQGKQQNEGQDQPPQQHGQPPPSQPNAGGSKSDQPPPNPDQPPQGAGPNPQAAGQPPQVPANGEPQHKDQSGGHSDQQTDDARIADNEHLPGQMSREEARELLDSVKGDEHHPLGAPLDRRDAGEQREPPFKDW